MRIDNPAIIPSIPSLDDSFLSSKRHSALPNDDHRHSHHAVFVNDFDSDSTRHVPAAIMGEPRPRQRKFAPRSRQGCLTCRTRRKRCDGEKPDCQNCTRLNMKCEWQQKRQIVTETSIVSTSSNESVRMALDKLSPLRTHVDPWEALPGDEHSEKKHLLRYYVEAMVPSISVATTPSSFYTSLYIPMAFQSEGMLDAILAMSSAQLARRTTDSDRAMHLRDLSSKHQNKCHLFLRERISPDGRPMKDPYQIIGQPLKSLSLNTMLTVRRHHHASCRPGSAQRY